MKLGIAGTGKIVQEALPVILETQPESICLMGREHSAARTVRLYEQYHLDAYVLDFESLLASPADTIYIALPNQLHYAFAKRALSAGKNVILEKPATVHKPQLEELFSLADTQGKILVEAMTLHYLPAFLSIKEKIADLGTIKLVNFQFCQYSSRYDAFLNGQIAPSFDPACAGGALMDLNVYNLHAIIALFGKPLSARYFPNMERGVDTSGILVMDYGSFQAVSIAAKDCQAPVSSTIQGTKGCIRIPVPANGLDRYELLNNAMEAETYDFSCGRHRMYWEFTEFSRIIDEKDFSAAAKTRQISLDVLDVLDQVRGPAS